MPSPSPSYQRLLIPAAIVVLLVLSLAPSRFHFYGDRLRDLSARALSPITFPVGKVEEVVTPEPPLADRGTNSDMRVRISQQEAELVRLREENDNLRNRVATLEGLRREIGSDFAFARGRVLGRSTDASAGTVQVSVGTNIGVAPGMAVVDADQLALVGRVVQAGPTSCAVEPLTVDGTLLEVIVAPANLSGADLSEVSRRRVLLEYDSDEGFVGVDIDRKMPIGVDHLARLSDRSGRIPWPNAVQGMVVGRVVNVQAEDDNPLRQQIRVEPIRTLRLAAEVIVVVPSGAVREAGP